MLEYTIARRIEPPMLPRTKLRQRSSRSSSPCRRVDGTLQRRLTVRIHLGNSGTAREPMDTDGRGSLHHNTR